MLSKRNHGALTKTYLNCCNFKGATSMKNDEVLDNQIGLDKDVLDLCM